MRHWQRSQLRPRNIYKFSMMAVQSELLLTIRIRIHFFSEDGVGGTKTPAHVGLVFSLSSVKNERK